MKAYAVLENMENTGGVIFADHAVVARRVGSEEFADGEFSDVSCRRAPWADEFAESGRLPASVCVDHGWWFECTGCGSTINEDWLYDNELPVEGVIGEHKSAVFCCSGCKENHETERAVIQSAQNKKIEMMKGVVRKRFPCVEFVGGSFQQHAYVRREAGKLVTRQLVVSFKFPGMQHGPASLHLDIPYDKVGPFVPSYHCCHGDREAFENFAKTEHSPKDKSHD